MAPRPGESLAQYDAGIRRAVSIDAAKSDTVDIPSGITRGIFVGVAGNVAVIFCDDVDSNPVTLTGLAIGVWHPLQVRRLMSTNTTATGILAGY